MRIHIHLTLTIEQAQWLVEHLQATELDTPWGKVFHRLAIQIERNLKRVNLAGA